MKMAGGGCLGCGVLLIMAALVVFCAAAVPGVVNSAETGTAVGIGGALCTLSFFPVLLGIVLLVMGRQQPKPPPTA